MVNQSILHKSHSSSAFSLVEVVLSLGIVSFTCLTFMGLLPLGMNSFHRAVDNTVEVDIVQSISTDMQLSSFNSLNSAQSPYLTPMYYSADGVKLSSAAGAVYTVTFSTPADLNTTQLFFGSQLASGAGSTVLIAVTSISQPGVTNYFPIILANNHQ